DEDRGADEEGHRVVLERAAVPVPHEVVDQALGALRVLLQLVQGLLTDGGHTGREQYVGVRRAVFDQLDGDVATELDLEVFVGVHGVRGLPVWSCAPSLYPRNGHGPGGGCW